jgi:predicted dehydrogenase
MTKFLSRRSWLRTALVGTGYWTFGTRGAIRADSPSEKLNLAVIGVGGRGRANLNALADQNIVALCDVDEERAGNAFTQFPRARKFSDFRRMFDALHRELDAVVVSTPDHTHFHAAMTAMLLDKHCYCEKPMAHTVVEVRAMTNVARDRKLATQLGVQRHALENVHRVVEIIRAGAIGQVTDVHCWVDGRRGMPNKPTSFPAVPPHLNWDLWLGPAEFRPYSPEYCPYKWRFWWDFGTGETGNWGCHILDIPFWALQLKYPNRVAALGPEVHAETTPNSMAVRFEFPQSGERPAVELHWYHAENGPPILQQYNLAAKGNNTLFIGQKGMLLCGFGKYALLPESDFADFQPPEPSIVNSPGFHQEWINACKGGEPATCDFEYSGPLTEAVLLGNVAYRAGEPLEWYAATLSTGGSQRANEFITPRYRAGWEFPM